MIATKLLLKVCVFGVAAVWAVATFADQVSEEVSLKADLAAVVAEDRARPVDGLTTAGQPDEDALRVFAESGYTTVIDLRGKNENRGLDEATVVSALGMMYVNLPINGPGEISYGNARKLNALIAAADGPVLVHCGSANRVGALLALQKKLEGADDDAAIAYGREAGMTRLEGRVKEVISQSNEE